MINCLLKKSNIHAKYEILITAFFISLSMKLSAIPKPGDFVPPAGRRGQPGQGQGRVSPQVMKQVWKDFQTKIAHYYIDLFYFTPIWLI